MKIAKYIAYGLAVVVIVVGLVVGSFYLKRTINYSLMYEDKVQETVRQMVRPEALKPEVLNKEDRQ